MVKLVSSQIYMTLKVNIYLNWKEAAAKFKQLLFFTNLSGLEYTISMERKFCYTVLNQANWSNYFATTLVSLQAGKDIRLMRMENCLSIFVQKMQHMIYL